MKKPTLRLILFTLVLLFIFSVFASVNADEDGDSLSDSDSDSDSIDELLAIDDEAEKEDQKGEISARSSEAEVLTKAQRIVLELNGDNTKRVVQGNEFVLILGYAPWCPRSAELMPQFAEAANALKELGSSLVMAKLDADRHPKAAAALEIKGFPTLLLFVNGVSQVYNGGFSAEEIVIWARKKTGDPVIRINSAAMAEEFLNKHETYVVGFFKKSKGADYDEFVKAAIAENDIQFVIVSDVEVAGVLFPNTKHSDNFVGIVKSEPERFTAYEGKGIKTEELLQFIDYDKFPLVIKLTEANSARVYSSPVKLQAMVFAKEDDFNKLQEPLKDVARKFKRKILFIYIDITDENLAKPFLTIYGLEDSKKTVVAAFDSSMTSKFLLKSEPTPSNIENFCSRLLDGTQTQYYKSQPIPDNKDANIHAVVGKSFSDLVLNSPKNVFLEVFTPWCIDCEATSKKVEKLAKHFKDSDLIFARFDAAMNEHPQLQVTEFPTLLFYRAGDKGNPITVSPKKSVKDLAKFISKSLKAKAAKDEL